MGEEIIYVVNEKDEFIRKATREEVIEKGLLHRVARVILTNKEGKILVHKRSINKLLYPGYWDIGIAETVVEGDSYESTAMRGLLEELGIIGISNIQMMHSFLFKTHYNFPQNNVLCKAYKLIYNGKISFKDGEVEEANFLALEEIKDLIENSKFSPGGKTIFEKYLKTIGRWKQH